MRIIAGKHKGKKLKEFDGTDIRPTSDKARQALFNILQFDISGSVFLDAFAGSGGVGIEAISRGAKTVIFTDKSREAIKLIGQNLDSIGEKAQVLLTDAVDFLSRTNLKFDFIFLDPPYASHDGEKALEIIAERKLLLDGGMAIFEHKTGDNRPIDSLMLVQTKKYGIAEIDFYMVKE